ncbi:hypothetical protein Taro_028432 [Colocasia esculenta]|uniref:G3BP-like protein n=1 Tax=Colocasia esculenta TaxID=4460 RepID=A0A843VX78_COLES|nr:hypothetical protein [Colocasia esculenta]
MASQEQQQAAAAPPQLVGNAFVHQYYHILHHSPELVHRFYQDVSKLGRPDGAGPLSTITTMEAINEKILSLEYSEYKSEIKTVDAQESYNNGVFVLVTGYLTGKDNVKKNFTQSFFLAPQDKGYFVLNDVFRYVDEADQQQQQQPENQVSTDVPEVPLSHEDEFSQQSEDRVPEQTVSPPEEGEEPNGEVVDNLSESDEGSVVDEETPISEVVDEVQNNSQAVVDSSPAPVLEEAPKKSYASIVKVMKENAAAPFPAPSARPAPVIPPRQTPTVATSSPAPEIPVSGSHGAESGDVQEAEVDGHSIYIKNLPLNATVIQLEEEFKRFGPIRPDGIQVRSNKQQGFCFGFVEFEVPSAVQSAIEASPITIGGRPAYVEEKRPSGSRVGNRGRFAPGRGGGFRGDGMRGRSSYGGGRGYGRGDYNNRPEFPIRGGGRSGNVTRGEGGYQRVDHSGNNGGRTNRATGLAVNASSKNVAPRVSAPA